MRYGSIDASWSAFALACRQDRPRSLHRRGHGRGSYPEISNVSRFHGSSASCPNVAHPAVNATPRRCFIFGRYQWDVMLPPSSDRCPRCQARTWRRSTGAASTRSATFLLPALSFGEQISATCTVRLPVYGRPPLPDPEDAFSSLDRSGILVPFIVLGGGMLAFVFIGIAVATAPPPPPPTPSTREVMRPRSICSRARPGAKVRRAGSSLTPCVQPSSWIEVSRRRSSA